MQPDKKRNRYNRPYRTGEDIDMLRENNSEKEESDYIDNDSVCDRNVDGA